MIIKAILLANLFLVSISEFGQDIRMKSDKADILTKMAISDTAPLV